MSSFPRSLRLACLLVVALWPTVAQAQVAKHSLSGNLRFQVSSGLPIPITTTAPPNGAIAAVPGATVMQTTGPDPRRMTIRPSQLTAPGDAFLLPIYGNEPGMFEVQTAIAVQFPRSTVTFQAGGRTGPPTLTWCPGQPLPTASYNPSCTDPRASGLPTTGLMRYKKTAEQFGGPARAAVQGIVTIAIAAAGSPPCDFEVEPCRAWFAVRPLAPIGAWGGSFGVYNLTPAPAPNPGLFNVRATRAGAITYVTPTGLGLGFGDSATSFGAPWTTGQVMVWADSSISGGTEFFTRTGSDARVSGVGNISLVSAAISVSAMSGPNADRGWLNLTVPEPTAVAGTASALLLLAACHGLVRRRGR